jgi:hypothetical protein
MPFIHLERRMHRGGALSAYPACRRHLALSSSALCHKARFRALVGRCCRAAVIGVSQAIHRHYIRAVRDPHVDAVHSWSTTSKRNPRRRLKRRDLRPGMSSNK